MVAAARAFAEARRPPPPMEPFDPPLVLSGHDASLTPY
jgi:hypothetical protein